MILVIYNTLPSAFERWPPVVTTAAGSIDWGGARFGIIVLVSNSNDSNNNMIIIVVIITIVMIIVAIVIVILALFSVRRSVADSSDWGGARFRW